MSSNTTHGLDYIVKALIDHAVRPNDTPITPELKRILTEYLIGNIQSAPRECSSEPRGEGMSNIYATPPEGSGRDEIPLLNGIIRAIGRLEAKQKRVKTYIHSGDTNPPTSFTIPEGSDAKQVLDKIPQTIKRLKNKLETITKLISQRTNSPTGFPGPKVTPENKEPITLTAPAQPETHQINKSRPAIVILCADTYSFNTHKSWQRLKNILKFVDDDYDKYRHYYIGENLDTKQSKKECDILIEGDISDQKNVISKLPKSIYILINEYCTNNLSVANIGLRSGGLDATTLIKYLQKLTDPGSIFVSYGKLDKIDALMEGFEKKELSVQENRPDLGGLRDYTWYTYTKKAGKSDSLNRT